MLKALFRAWIRKFERDNDYDASYLHYILQTSTAAFWQMNKLQGFAHFRRDLPEQVAFAAGITAVMAADCGPCTQLVVGWAEKAGMPAATIKAIVQRDFDRMPADIALVVRFTNATLAHDFAADALREQIKAKWGDRALVSLGFGISSAAIWPTLKYALGYGHACVRVKVAGENVAVSDGTSGVAVGPALVG